VHSYICGRVELNASGVIRSKAIVVLGKDTGIQMHGTCSKLLDAKSIFLL